MLSRAEGTDIAWKAGKNVTVKVCLFRQPSAYVGHACPSFTRKACLSGCGVGGPACAWGPAA